jgi:D-erythrulose 4-kinase
MTPLYNDPSRFADEAIDAFVAAHREWVGDQDPPTVGKIAAAIHAARFAVIETGGAQVGDKTLVDVLIPFDGTLSNEISRTGDLAAAWDRAAREAEHAARATKNLLPRTDRARPHAEKSLGSPDAGALSVSPVVAAVGTLWRSTPQPAQITAYEGSHPRSTL